MQRLLTTAVLVSLLVFSCKTEGGRETDVMTFNIRFGNPRDSINAWPNRAGMVAGFINDQVPDLLGLQEVLWHQYEFLGLARCAGIGRMGSRADKDNHLGKAL